MYRLAKDAFGALLLPAKFKDRQFTPIRRYSGGAQEVTYIDVTVGSRNMHVSFFFEAL